MNTQQQTADNQTMRNPNVEPTIRIIGRRNTIIGFGLCGFEDLLEVSERATSIDICNAITSSRSQTIVIEEELFSLATPNLPKHEKLIITIPQSQSTDDIDALVSAALGTSITD